MAKHATDGEGSMKKIGEGVTTDRRTGESVVLKAFMHKPSRAIVATRGGGKHRKNG